MHVLLGEAGALLDGLAKTTSGECVFSGANGDGPLSVNALYWFSIRARDAAGIVVESRLDDLPTPHAYHADVTRQSLHVAGRLLGHRRVSTTNRYVHLDDMTLSQATERVAVAIQRRPSAAASE